MLNDKVIIYDDSCPMCKLYTFWFVAWGFLKPENRIGFATAPAEFTQHIDLERGRHEIPLFDRSTHETIYGLDALTHLLASRWSWLNPIFESKLFWWTFHPLYEIITYNRRVIAGCKACCGFDCAPNLNRFYRSVYLGLASCFIAIVATLLAGTGNWIATISFGLLAVFLILGVSVGVLTRATKGSLAGWNYAGNYFTTVLMVAATMLPLVFTASLPDWLAWTILATGLVVGLEELWRRELWTLSRT